MGKADKKPKYFTALESAGNQLVEDKALKKAVHFFGTVLLPLLGVTGKVRRIAPTEQIHLEMRSFFEDFNFEMEDGTWNHFEFDSITQEDLRRFRSYEAITGYCYGVEVTTHVVCTANAKVLTEELRKEKSSLLY